ncbi:hypothetical protein TTHERM_000196348 (macronuclear) [Tetrahymena thermophila SB210]|uniref:Transmembrane protein n=1 Tax=Tetrahymena thermophila (strain SB210) TaxID=312017 RepID=W7XC70_TETTS|nr:hypothetical protein TTHERM_000196348 [Tetrahymena thermophila SB210]EWS74113.1 hypothetical protein TTHERM_000196348 [Tetrahymena thermophila SB210]|eukprot:XP_012653368.1 hypothetical protein TTHERM_000196348 [Tetrahymena thermophila SB210]
MIIILIISLIQLAISKNQYYLDLSKFSYLNIGTLQNKKLVKNYIKIVLLNFDLYIIKHNQGSHCDQVCSNPKEPLNYSVHFVSKQQGTH